MKERLVNLRNVAHSQRKTALGVEGT